MKISKFVFAQLSNNHRENKELSQHEEYFISASADSLEEEIFLKDNQPIKEVLQQHTHVDISVEELEIAKNIAFDEGYNKAKEEIFQQKLAIKNKINNLLENIKQSLDQYLAIQEKQQHDLDSKLLSLTMTIAKKLANKALSYFPQDAINDVILSNLNLLKDESKLFIYLSEDLKVPRQEIEELLINHGIKAEIHFVDDPHLQPYECKIEWKKTILERNQSDIEEQIEQILIDSGITEQS